MNNGDKTGENGTQQVRRTTGENRGLCLEGGERGAISDSQRFRDIVQRVHGTTGEEGSTCIAGGIIAQLVKQAERRLGNAVACIDWYEREKAEALQELNELRQLATLVQAGEASTNEKEQSEEEKPMG